MHPCQERPTDEGDVVNDKELYFTPLPLQLPIRISCELFLPSRVWEDLETRARGFRSEAYVKRSDARVRRQFDRAIDAELMEK